MSIFRNWFRIFKEARIAEYKFALNTAHQLFDDRKYKEAAHAYDSLVRRPKDVARNTVNRGYCELMMGELETAHASFLLAAKLDPKLAQAQVGLGDVFARQAQHIQAVDAYTRSIQLQPGFATAHTNRAQSLTALGRLAEAWADAEFRFSLPNHMSIYPHTLALPQWDGRKHGRIFVHWEQGFGDIIQHLRFLSVASQRGHKLCFECPPQLATLVRRMENAPDLIEATEYSPSTKGMDFKVGLLSLPHLLSCNEYDLGTSPYLRVDTNKKLMFQTMRVDVQLPHIGIVWRSNIDDAHSAPLEWLLNCAQRVSRPLQLVSLQGDVDSTEAALLERYGCMNVGSKLSDFDDIAAAISAMDTIISVDAPIAHLAGALGSPTHLLLSEPCATRWMLARADTPWYQNMKLLRKRANDHWQPLLTQALEASLLAKAN